MTRNMCECLLQATDGLVAVEKLQKRQLAGEAYTIILMDFMVSSCSILLCTYSNICHRYMMYIQMPNMNGALATAKIRRMGYTGLIVGVTGNSQDADIHEFMSAGLDHLFVKPLDINQLIAYVENKH